MKVATQIVERRVVADDCRWMPMRPSRRARRN